MGSETTLQIPLTSAEKKGLLAKAQAAGLKLGPWARRQLLGLDKQPGDGDYKVPDSKEQRQFDARRPVPGDEDYLDPKPIDPRPTREELDR